MNKAVVTLLITFIYMLIVVYFYLPEVDLKEGKVVLDPYIPLTSQNLGIFLTYVLIPLSIIFELAHETICIL